MYPLRDYIGPSFPHSLLRTRGAYELLRNPQRSKPILPLVAQCFLRTLFPFFGTRFPYQVANQKDRDCKMVPGLPRIA